MNSHDTVNNWEIFPVTAWVLLVGLLCDYEFMIRIVIIKVNYKKGKTEEKVQHDSVD